MASSKNYNNLPTNSEPISQTATSRENGRGDFSSTVAERAGSYSAQPEAYEPRVALAMASEASQKVRVRVGKLPYSEQFADQVVSQTLANAEFLFTHWVWVAGVDEGEYDSNGVLCSKVSYTGDNIPGVDDTTITDYNYWPESDIYHLPWKGGYTTITDQNSPYYGRYISTTQMVWHWQQYTEYVENNPRQHPDISTRYADGSP